MNCKLCVLHTVNKRTRIAPHIGSDVRMSIILDHPFMLDCRMGRFGHSEPSLFLKWLLGRMSVDLKNVYIDFALKCYKPKNLLTHKSARIAALQSCKIHFPLSPSEMGAVVACGKIATELFPDTPWKACSIGAPLASPAATVDLYGTLFEAAESVKLKPKPVRDYTYEYPDTDRTGDISLG